MWRKVHARTICDDCSVRARGKNNPRQEAILDGFEQTAYKGLSRYKSAKVTKMVETPEVERGKPRERETQIW